MNAPNFEMTDTNKNRFNDFFTIYSLQNVIDTNVTSRIYLGNAESKRCRFCNKTSHETSFITEAHVIPRGIGNRYLLSHFECDQCNKVFSQTYDDSFASYMSAIRPFANVKNRNKKGNKNVKHKEEKSGLEIVHGENSVEVTFSATHPEVLDLNREEKRLTIKATLPPYIPIFVYKEFLKIAMSMIDESELACFKRAFYMLQNNNQDYKLKGGDFYKICIHSIPGIPLYNKPVAILYNRRPEFSDANQIEKVLVMHFANKIFVMYLPFNDADLHIEGQTIKPLIYPVIMPKSYFDEYGLFTSKWVNLSSNERTVGEQVTHSMTFEEGLFDISQDTASKI